MPDFHSTGAGPTASASRRDAWIAGWRVALRMARRDVRRHRGRSLLVVIMVGLPVLLLSAGSTLWFSEDVDAAERLPLQLGQTQGYLVEPLDRAVHQLLDPHTSYGLEQEARAVPVPGYGPGREGAALGELVGARLHAMTLSSGTARADGHVVGVAVLGADPRGAGPVLSPRVSLQSGRWPASPDEVVVTATGLHKGLPRAGSLEMREQRADGTGTDRTLTVVGVGTGLATWGPDDVHPVELVGLPSHEPDADRQWLVERSAPITWPEVERLNTYGVGAYSSYVVEHPDTVQLPEGVALPGDTSKLFVVLAASTALLLLTTLLAGPAFAVSASRQRHSLALAASNGATRGQLRRTVLGQAVVLGVLSALSGAALGVGTGLGLGLVARRIAPDRFFAPAEVSWGSVAIVTVAGVVSSVVAALVPSRGLGRLDIVSVLRGQNVSPPLRRRVPLVGVALAALGAGSVWFASYRSQDGYFLVFVGGVLLLAVGALMLVPLVLASVGRLAHQLPLPARMAAREAGRLRGRATPTVAAIMGGAAVLTTVCVGLQADTERGARTYSAETATGQALVRPGPLRATTAELSAAVHSADPSLLTLGPRWLSESPDGTATRLVAAVPGCSFAETAPEIVYSGGLSTDAGRLPRCATVSADAAVPGSTLLVVDVDEFADFTGLDAAQRSGLARGGVALLDPSVAATLPPTTLVPPQGASVDELRPLDIPVRNGSTSWFRYVVTYGSDALPRTDRLEPTEVQLPAVLLTHEQWTRAVIAGYGGPGAFLSAPAADRLGLKTRDDLLLVRGTSALTETQETALRDAVQARFPDGTVEVERGYQRHDLLAVGIAIGVIALIILVATLIATALGQAEAAPLLGTLAAVGATRRTRRALAASQAVYLAVVGAVMGVLVGMVPGIAASRVLTATYTDPGMDFSTVIISIPWLQILLPVLLVPVVAGALAWFSIRRAPVVVRRAT